MIKICAFFKRRSGMEVEAFQEYWRTVHGPIAAALPGLRRYVQSHVLPGIYRRSEPAYDGLAELWFESADVLKELAASGGDRPVREDHAKFMDVASYVELVTREHVIKDGATPAEGVKNVEFVKRREGLAVEAFQKYWREVHGPLAAAIDPIRRYVQCHATSAAYRGSANPPWDGLALTWFESVDAMRASASTAEYEATRTDEPNFVRGELPFVIVREHVLV